MKTPIKIHPAAKIFTGSLVDLPSPSRISYFWNFGSLLGLCLIIQILSGLFLSIHYSNNASIAFFRIVHCSWDINLGWLLRIVHANGASAFFICLYLHAGRGVYYGSYSLKHTWGIGVVILLSVMATAFLGYVLPWGQISFWGAAVITKLLSTVPYFGPDIVQWLWGDYGVSEATLTRFFALHFLLPFVISGLSIVHLLLLHQSGSSNPLGLNSNFDKLLFHAFFSLKDLLGIAVLARALIALCCFNPWVLGDPENFNMANIIITPVHIQPEWYFLFAYAILRSIPNKFGGVIALGTSVLILITLPYTRIGKFRNNRFYPLNKLLFWCFVNFVALLTWVGARPVEDPYIITGQILTILYFLFYLFFRQIQKLWDLITA